MGRIRLGRAPISTTLAIELSKPTAGHEAELAAVEFLARYSGRTLESYRYDLRSFFQWTVGVGLDVLAATRPHIELFRSSLEERGLAPATIDRRLSTVCGFYRFAHIDGRFASNLDTNKLGSENVDRVG